MPSTMLSKSLRKNNAIISTQPPFPPSSIIGAETMAANVPPNMIPKTVLTI